jgi:hypothetical protein
MTHEFMTAIPQLGQVTVSEEYRQNLIKATELIYYYSCRTCANVDDESEGFVEVTRTACSLDSILALAVNILRVLALARSVFACAVP